MLNNVLISNLTLISEDLLRRYTNLVINQGVDSSGSVVMSSFYVGHTKFVINPKESLG